MDILEIINFIIKMILVSGAVLIGIFILAIIIGSVRELLKIFFGEANSQKKGKK